MIQDSSLEFLDRADSIAELLSRANMGFESGMTEEVMEELYAQRQSFVLRAGWNDMPVEDLRALMQSPRLQPKKDSCFVGFG